MGLTGFLLGAWLFLTRSPWLGMATVFVVIGLGLPLFKALGLAETHTWEAGDAGLTVTARSPWRGSDEQRIPWERVAELAVTTVHDGETGAHTWLAVRLTDGASLSVPARGREFAALLQVIQAHLPALGYDWVPGEGGWVRLPRGADPAAYHASDLTPLSR